MIRSLLVAALLPAIASTASAQPLAPGVPASPLGTPPLAPGIPAGQPGGFGGGVRPGTGVLPVPTPLPIHPRPIRGLWGGFGYGFGGYPVYGYGYGYAAPVVPAAPRVVDPELPGPNIALVKEFPASLTLEFPAPAEVWVNGKKGAGDPTTEWNLTSPPLKAGTEYTFEVKARWKAGGKTYEYERVVSVASGNRSRALVVAGSEVKE